MELGKILGLPGMLLRKSHVQPLLRTVVVSGMQSSRRSFAYLQKFWWHCSQAIWASADATLRPAAFFRWLWPPSNEGNWPIRAHSSSLMPSFFALLRACLAAFFCSVTFFSARACCLSFCCSLRCASGGGLTPNLSFSRSYRSGHIHVYDGILFFYRPSLESQWNYVGS